MNLTRPNKTRKQENPGISDVNVSGPFKKESEDLLCTYKNIKTLWLLERKERYFVKNIQAMVSPTQQKPFLCSLIQRCEINSKVKVKQSCCRPGVAQRVPGS